MPFVVYILQSQIANQFYIGQTADERTRLKQHNGGKVRSTKAFRPWKVVHTEIFESRSQAMKREMFLKSPEGWKDLQNIKSSIRH